MSKTTFVVASHNQHKLKEFARILEPLDIEIVTPSQCGGEKIDPVENGDTFEANAIIKATEFAINDLFSFTTLKIFPNNMVVE